MPLRRVWLLGAAIAAALVLLPLDAWLGAAFPAHMLRHMGLVAVAAPLISAGLPAHAPLVPPIAAAALEAGIVWLWHLPAAHALAFRSGPGFLAEQAAFLLAGLLVWTGAFAARERLLGALALLLTSMHMTLLGALLILAPRDLYAALCGTAPNLDAQQVGGLLMLAIGTPVYLAGGLWLVRRALAGGDEVAA